MHTQSRCGLEEAEAGVTKDLGDEERVAPRKQEFEPLTLSSLALFFTDAGTFFFFLLL